MPRALDLAVEDLSFGERSLRVAAAIADGMDRVPDTEEGDSLIVHFDTESTTVR